FPDPDDDGHGTDGQSDGWDSDGAGANDDELWGNEDALDEISDYANSHKEDRPPRIKPQRVPGTGRSQVRKPESLGLSPLDPPVSERASTNDDTACQSRDHQTPTERRFASIAGLQGDPTGDNAASISKDPPSAHADGQLKGDSVDAAIADEDSIAPPLESPAALAPTSATDTAVPPEPPNTQSSITTDPADSSTVDTGQYERPRMSDDASATSTASAGPENPPLSVPRTGVTNRPATPPKTPTPAPKRAAAPPPTPPRLNIGSLKIQIPNGTQNKAFQHTIPVPAPTNWPGEWNIGEAKLQIGGLEDTGVTAKAQGNNIVFGGVPTVSGDHPLRIKIVIPAADDHSRPKAARAQTINWYINPDPRSLWKTIEPDASLPYAKPHADSLYIDAPAKMIAASVRGRSHAHEGTFRDDDFLMNYDAETGWYVMVVADGAGSAKFSRQGSLLACDVIGNIMKSHFRGALDADAIGDAVKRISAGDDEAVRNVRHALYSALGTSAHAAFKKISDYADSHDSADLKDFSTTLIFTVFRPFPEGWFVAAFCIGDGGVGVYRTDGEVIVLNEPDGGEYAGQTRFLTMPDIWVSGEKIYQRLHFQIVDQPTAVIAMTDGISDPKFGTDNNFIDTRCWHELWADLGGEINLDDLGPGAENDLLKWMDFWSA
ncbi:MAG: protein phosphatase 2C domain-containing protein, partial [Planctomycetota bacterium]